jgi:hypothetical protein
MNRRLSSGSSDDLGFHNSKVRVSTASAPDEPAVRPAVHLMPSFKLSRDTPMITLQHRMNRRFSGSSAVHPTPVFNLDKDTLSGSASAPDKPMVRRSITSV